MKLGICTIQKNRAPWLVEWFAFHYLVGFRNFYFFAHQCSDQTAQIIVHLQKRLNIKAFVISRDAVRPQLMAYQYAYANFGDEVDWMAFIDGDEFLFPTRSRDLVKCLDELDNGLISAYGVYWSCFGSSRFLIEPPGLITENYRHRAPDDFDPNSHVKSIVRGGLGNSVSVSSNSHIFLTPNGTFDESHRPITSGYTQNSPTWEHMKINHYVCQSRGYFTDVKQKSGAADSNAHYVRPESWWEAHDKNEIYDTSLCAYYLDLKRTIKDLCR
jgi:hypothetical protein